MAVIYDPLAKQAGEAEASQVLRLSVDSDGDLRITDLTEDVAFCVRPENIQALAEAVSAIAAELKKVEPDNG